MIEDLTKKKILNFGNFQFTRKNIFEKNSSLEIELITLTKWIF